MNVQLVWALTFAWKIACMSIYHGAVSGWQLINWSDIFISHQKHVTKWSHREHQHGIICILFFLRGFSFGTLDFDFDVYLSIERQETATGRFVGFLLSLFLQFSLCSSADSLKTEALTFSGINKTPCTSRRNRLPQCKYTLFFFFFFLQFSVELTLAFICLQFWLSGR